MWPYIVIISLAQVMNYIYNYYLKSEVDPEHTVGFQDRKTVTYGKKREAYQ